MVGEALFCFPVKVGLGEDCFQQWAALLQFGPSLALNKFDDVG